MRADSERALASGQGMLQEGPDELR